MPKSVPPWGARVAGAGGLGEVNRRIETGAPSGLFAAGRCRGRRRPGQRARRRWRFAGELLLGGSGLLFPQFRELELLLFLFSVWRAAAWTASPVICAISSSFARTWSAVAIRAACFSLSFAPAASSVAISVWPRSRMRRFRPRRLGGFSPGLPIFCAPYRRSQQGPHWPTRGDGFFGSLLLLFFALGRDSLFLIQPDLQGSGRLFINWATSCAARPCSGADFAVFNPLQRFGLTVADFEQTLLRAQARPERRLYRIWPSCCASCDRMVARERAASLAASICRPGSAPSASANSRPFSFSFSQGKSAGANTGQRAEIRFLRDVGHAHRVGRPLNGRTRIGKYRNNARPHTA